MLTAAQLSGLKKAEEYPVTSAATHDFAGHVSQGTINELAGKNMLETGGSGGPGDVYYITRKGSDELRKSRGHRAGSVEVSAPRQSSWSKWLGGAKTKASALKRRKAARKSHRAKGRHGRRK
jgi:hypothetical protein